MQINNVERAGTKQSPTNSKKKKRPTFKDFLKNMVSYLWEGPDSLNATVKLEWRFAAIRWIGILLLIPGLLLFDMSPQRLLSVYGVLIVAGIYNLSVVIMLQRRTRASSIGYITTVCDALLNIAMIYFAGGFDSPFYFILYTVVVSAAIRYGYGPVLATALIFVIADFIEGLLLRDTLGAPFFLRSAFLLLTSVIAAYLREQAQEAEAALEERLNQARALNKELEAFSYSVSHDLRAPLRSIDGFSQALLEDYNDILDEDGQDYLRRVRAASQRMAQLIDDLLNLSRVTRSEMQKERVNVSDIAHSIIDDLHKNYPERQVAAIVAPNVITEADPRLLRAVLENLLGNAWKFTSKKENPRVEFGMEEHAGKMTIFVRDNGVGFDMSYIDKLFGAFQRLHSMNEFEGNGIGLATVQRIIHRHGGKVWAEGEVGRGAAFYFTL